MPVAFEYGADIQLLFIYTKNGDLQAGETVTYDIYNRSNGNLAYSGTMTEHGTIGGVYLASITPSPSVTTYTQYIVTYSDGGKIINGEEIQYGLPTATDKQEILDAIEEADRSEEGGAH